MSRPRVDSNFGELCVSSRGRLDGRMVERLCNLVQESWSATNKRKALLAVEERAQTEADGQAGAEAQAEAEVELEPEFTLEPEPEMAMEAEPEAEREVEVDPEPTEIDPITDTVSTASGNGAQLFLSARTTHHYHSPVSDNQFVRFSLRPVLMAGIKHHPKELNRLVLKDKLQTQLLFHDYRSVIRNGYVESDRKNGKMFLMQRDIGGLSVQEFTDSVQKIVRLVSMNEGKATSINWNDNGYGISVGMFQANQKVGELPALLRRMYQDAVRVAQRSGAIDAASKNLFTEIFGSSAADLLDEKYVRGVSISRDGELGIRLQKALEQPLFQRTQLQMIGEKVLNCAKLCRQYGITSEAGVALYTDMVNQLGFSGAERFLSQVIGESEEGRVESLDMLARNGSRYRASRNVKVQQQIAQLQLDRSAGTFLS